MWEFPCGTVGKGPHVGTEVALVAAVAQVPSLAGELPYAVDAEKKKKGRKERKKKNHFVICYTFCFPFPTVENSVGVESCLFVQCQISSA